MFLLLTYHLYYLYIIKLQENIIIKLTKNAKQRDVTLSTSHNQLFNDYIEKTVSFKSIVKDSDKERFIHIPINELDIKNDLFKINSDIIRNEGMLISLKND